MEITEVKSDLNALGVRFAPSPTGRFHLGNLRTAWISHQWARALGQPWILRFEDIDRPRVLAGACDQQLADLKLLGIEADQIIIQSELRARHWGVFRNAVLQRIVYPCYCSRKDVRGALEVSASAPHQAPLSYSGRCRGLGCFPHPDEHGLPTIAWRFAFQSDPSGRQDFIVARSQPELDSTGLPDVSAFTPAYHWACAIDDEDGNYALLVRAHDLSGIATQQRAIGEWLAGLESRAPRNPAIYHSSLVVRNNGQRLEKRTRGVTLPELLEQGWTPERILERFAESFRLPVGDFSLHRMFGEPNPTITLQELGFPG